MLNKHAAIQITNIDKLSFEVKIMVLNGVPIVTTTWNERENIEKLILTIRNVLPEIPHKIVVVDDANSPNGTITIAKSLAEVAVTKEENAKPKAYSMGCNSQSTQQ